MDSSMSVKSFVAILLTYLVGMSLLSYPPALAQGDPALNQPRRLARPGEVAPMPTGNQPFTLGVQEQHLGAATSGFDGQAGTPQLDPNQSGTQPFRMGTDQAHAGFPDLNIPLRNQEKDLPAISVQMLSKYNLELIVDQSMSMLTMDCPGFKSRWEWCGLQAQDLANQLTPYVPGGLTITAFAKHYYVHPNSSAQSIAELFSNPAFGRGTRLAEPLDDRLSNYFATRGPGTKPLLIAVITDGVPVPDYEPGMVVQTLIKAANHVKDPHEVTLVFFQIGGGDRKGREFLHHLDTNLVNFGARYDIVQVVPFDHLEQVGLAQALIESIKDFANESHGQAAGGLASKRPRFHN
jgi:hypothetical protein